MNLQNTLQNLNKYFRKPRILLAKIRHIKRHTVKKLAPFALGALVIIVPLTYFLVKNNVEAEAAWWPGNGNQWVKRKNLELFNTTSESLAATTTVAITVNTKELVSEGKLRQDCADLRVLYQPNTDTAAEVTRHLIFPAGESCATSETTKVYFPLQATLGASSKSYDYYMYFANPDAEAPTDTDRAFDIGEKQALLVCPFNGTTECAAGETPSTENGPLRYQGDKSALYFKPRDASISLGNPSSLRNLPQGTFTIETWFNMYTPGPNDYYNYLWASNASGGPDFRVTIMPHDRQIQFLITCSTQNARAYSNYHAFTLNQWNHFAVTYDDQGDRTPRMYLNGQEMTYLTSSACQGDYQGDSSYNKYIGASEWATPRLSATLDEYRISNVVRYTSNFTPQTTPFARDNSTLLLYHFDENGNDPRNSGRALDDSGNGNHGTITGAKYVSGLIGVDKNTTISGNTPQQAYASHEGIFVEEGTTNKITNPSFEHATYNTNWTASGGTATENTNPTYVKFGSKSYKLTLSDSTDRTVTTSLNAGNTNTHVLSAYVYRGTGDYTGGTVNSSVAQLVFNGSAQTTTYTEIGGGWWRLTYTAAAGAGSQSYGVQVNENSGTLYIDGVQLEENPYQYVTSYADGSLGEGYSWTGTPNESTSTRAASEVAGYDREGNFSCEQGTISFWMKKQTVYPAVSEYYPRILALRRIGEDTIGFHQGYRGGNLTFQLTGYNPSYYSYSTDYNISGWALNSWHHVVGTYEDNGTAVLYVDGVQRNSVNLGDLAADCGSTFEFRTTLQSSNRPGNQIIADLRSYNAPLTAGEVADLYQAGLVSHSHSYEVNRFSGDKGQDPLAIWHFDESYGSTAHDSSTYKHNLAISGASWNTQSAGSHSRLVRNLQFDGTDDAATLQAGSAGNFNFGTGSFTLSGWFRHASTISGTDTIVAKYNTAGYKVYMNSSGQICFGIDDDSTWNPDNSACSTQSYANSKWHHFEAVYDSTGDVIPAQAGIHLFIDGLLVTSDTSLAATGSLSNSAPLTVGADSNSTDFWTGNLDEIIIYPYARSEEQVKTDFAGGQTSAYFGASQNDFMTDGLVGYWKMDEAGNTSRADSSGNGNTLTQSAGDVIDAAAGKFGSGADFENSSSEAETLYIDDSSHNGLDITGQITIATWVRRESIQWGLNNLVSKHHSDSGQRSYMLTLNGNHLEFWLSPDGNSTTEVSIAEAVPLNDTWYHIVGAYDGTRMMLYINGSLASDPVSYNGGIFNSTANFRIGGSDSGWYFDGVIDETRIYNRALSPDEIRQLYEWAPGPVGYWDLNEGTGVTAYDKSGNNNHGTLGGDGVGSDVPTWDRGQYGDALKFGTDDFVSVADAPELQISGAMTLSMWLKPESASSTGYLISKSGPSGNRGYYLRLSPTNLYISVSAAPDSVYSTSVTFDWTPYINKWVHITGIYEPGLKTELYVDGKKIGGRTDSVPSSQHSNNSQPLLFGARSTEPPFYLENGQIDEVKIYNYARTPQQIIEDMNAGHPAPGSPIGSALLHWKLDENGNTTAYNSGSDDTLQGTITNATWPTGCVINGCVGFGAGGSVSLTDPSFTDGLTSFTASLWVNPQTLLTNAAIFAKSGLSQANNHAFLIRTDESNSDEIRVYIGDGFDTNDYFTTTNLDLTTSTWYHVTVVYDGSASAANRIKVYKNGRPVAGTMTGTIPTSMLSSSTANFTVGNSDIGGGDGLAAHYDDIKFYTFAMTAEQVRVELNRGFMTTLGALSTTASGQADSSRDRRYCPPGNTETNCAPGLDASPTLEWTLDENTGTSTVRDTAGNITAKNGTMNAMSSSSWVPGALGSALTFDGSTSYLSHNDHNDLDFVSDVGFSVEAWFKHGTASAVETIISKYETTNTDGGYQLFMESNGEITCRVYRNNTLNGSDFVTSTGISYDDNQWHHVVCTKQDVSPYVALYVDGVLVGTDTVRNMTQSLPNNDPFYVGRNGDAAAYWTGQIDNVAVYRYARTQAQVSWSYNRGAPVGWWKFDDCQGTVASDSSGNGNHGAIVTGSGTYTSAGTCAGNAGTEMWAAGANGKRNASLGFDGSDDYVSIVHNRVFNITNDITIAAWIKRGSIGPWSPIVAKTNGSVWDYDFYIEDSSNELIFYSDDTSPDHIGTGAGAITDTTNWHHVAVTRRGTSVTIYIDGNVKTTGTMTGAFGANTAPVIIGCDDGSCSSDTFHGNIDDVRIYNYALSAHQIRTILNDGAVRFGP